MKTVDRKTPRRVAALALAAAAALAVALATVDGRGGVGGLASGIVEGRHETAAEGFGVTARRHVYEKGEGTAMHEHRRPRLVVVLSGGTLEATSPDGTTRLIELESGAASVRPAEAHALRNVGMTTVELIEAEFPAGD
ncbi:MAG: hypothetical protein OEQ13_13345 [Acidobacteriota bacterium]|nr:hypothetical protein [Acidobacteriota bacterium]